MVEAIKRYNEARWGLAMESGMYYNSADGPYAACLRDLWLGSMATSANEWTVRRRVRVAADLEAGRLDLNWLEATYCECEECEIEREFGSPF